MAPRPGDLKSSLNAGEFSPELYGKLGLKQYYSAGKQVKNLEPVPQAGFRLMPGTALVDQGRSATVRHCVLKVSQDLSYTLIFTAGWVDIYRNDRVKVASVAAPAITSALLPDLRFYGEANTVGVFHQDLQSLRLYRNVSDDTDWTLDLWPYEALPVADLGGTYTSVADTWDMVVRWSDASPAFVLQLSIDGQAAPAISLEYPPASASAGNWSDFVSAMQTAINDLPGIGSGVTVTNTGVWANARPFRITFGGVNQGKEFEVVSSIVNTSEASALSYHVVIGKRDLEPIVSASRGWFSGVSLFQDRAIYHAPKARNGALAMSAVGEYFDLDIKVSSPSAARLDALRTQTSERILHLMEANYLLIFTDSAEWFISNRTISRDEPVNFVRASTNGITANVPPVEIDGRVYFCSGKSSAQEQLGQTVYSATYDDVASRFVSEPESLLAAHLVDGISGGALQAKVSKNSAARWWMVDRSGRLICALVIRNQEITAFVEWIAADGGQVKAVSVDGQNQVWLTVQRGSVVTLEIMEEQETNLFQGAVSGATDLAGRFTGLDLWNGRQVWARADGFILGPFTVSGGAINLDQAASSVKCGLWQPPLFESLPYYRVLPNDQVLMRPGRVHGVTANIIETEAIAIGANGREPKAVPLADRQDPGNAPLSAKTKKIRVSGLKGVADGTTVVITQTRPGMLQVRDYVPEASL